MKNLAELKRRIKAALNNPFVLVKATVTGTDGRVYFDHPPATVVRGQEREFAVERNGRPSWLDYGKSAQWTFDGDTATHNDRGRKVTLTFIQN